MWRAIQRQNIIHIETLCAFLNLNDVQRQKIIKKSPFPLNLPLRLAHKIEKKTLEDPILKQFVPLQEEEKEEAGFDKNPVGDIEAKITPRLLKKYPGRALLIPSSACAMHCRYCFRRHFDYEKSDLREEIAQIAKDKSIKEVILSGGDPLSLSDEKLKEVLDQLQLPHIKRIRFHSRFPVGIPERIDSSFLSLLESTSKQIWFVIHINHPNEFDPVLFERLKEISRLGIPILNQAVLLKGVNDSIETLQTLFEGLADFGVLPYYLHQLDRVQGAAHFEVPLAEGHFLIRELAKRLSGYALPRFVQEERGKLHKTFLSFEQVL